MISSVEREIQIDELLPLIRERLKAGQSIRNLSFRGTSMLPMLRQRKDTVEIEPLPPRLKKYDLPIYQYPNGKVVMHRIVAVREDRYICLGDNTYTQETVYPEQLIAVVRAFQRGNRRIQVDSFWYQLYCRIWVALFPIRRFLVRAMRWLRRRFPNKTSNIP